jgi:hypothetical protein
MSKLKHTPGLWVMYHNITYNYYEIDNGVKLKIADVHRESDARLIAAAPEMLQLIIDEKKCSNTPCKECKYVTNSHDCKLNSMIDDIIEKATGMKIKEVLKDE